MKKVFTIIILLTFIIGVGAYYILKNNTQDREPFIHSFNDINSLDIIVDQIGNESYVLIGEASHGTAEFYNVRAELTKKLILDKEISFIAVEGDWSSIYELNRYVKQLPNSKNNVREIMQDFDRWPSWMWANEEVAEFIEWLREYNKGVSVDSRVGFYGMDVYGMWPSVEKVHLALQELGEHEMSQAMYDCLVPYKEDFINDYVQSIVDTGNDCVEEIANAVELLEGYDNKYEGELFKAYQNTLVIQGAEKHARHALSNQTDSWNSRVRHMKKTVENLRNFYGENSKGVLWAHNTHLGDARATDMIRAGQVNMGQLLREKYGLEDNYIVGFGTYEGTVIAGRTWGDAHEIMRVPEAVFQSYESMLNQKEEDLILLFKDYEVPESYRDLIGHRAIGVVYNPETERAGNYVPTRLSERYDAFIFIRQTQALTPI